MVGRRRRGCGRLLGHRDRRRLADLAGVAVTALASLLAALCLCLYALDFWLIVAALS